MSNNRKVQGILVIVISLWILSGCVNKKIIDEINIEGAAAFENLDDGNIIGTILVQEYLPDKTINNKTYTSIATMRREVLISNQKQTSGPIVLGGLKMTIFGEKLAKEGILDFIDSYQRDPSIGARNYLTTASTNPSKILQGDYGNRGNSVYLNDLIEHNIDERDVPKTNLHIFLRDFYAKGKDPYLPELKQLDKKHLEISGISLFKEDKKIDTLPVDKMFYFKLLADKHSQGKFKLKMDNGESAIIKSIKSKHKYQLAKNKEPHEVIINLNIEGVVQEYTGLKITPKIVKQIEKEVKEKVEKECLKLVNHFQDLKIDPLGIGILFRKSIRKYDFEKSYEKDYEEVAFKIKSNVKIVETGIID